MATVGSLLPNRPERGNVQLEDDTYAGTITKILTWAEDGNGKKINDPAQPHNKARAYVKLDATGEDEAEITLSRKMGFFVSPNAVFAAFLSAATGIDKNDTPALRAINLDDLIGKPIRVVTEYNADSGYTNISRFLAPKRAAQPATPAQAAA